MNKTNNNIRNKNFRVSAILLCYNHAAYIDKALESVFNQDYPNYEVIIRDDASTDDSPRIIDKYLLTKNKKNIQNQFIKGEKNIGLVGSYNCCLKYGEGDLIVAFAGDDYSKTNRISKIVKIFISYPIDLVACDALVIDQKNRILSKSFYVRKNYDQYSNIGDLQGNLRFIPPYKITNKMVSFGGFGLAFRKKLLNLNKGYLPEKIFNEDNYICFLAMLGNGIVFCYEPLVYWRKHDGNFAAKLNINNMFETLKNYILKEIVLFQSQLDVVLKNNYKFVDLVMQLKRVIFIRKIYVKYLEGKLNFNMRIIYVKEIFLSNSFNTIGKIKYTLYLIFPYFLKLKLKKEFFQRNNYTFFNQESGKHEN